MQAPDDQFDVVVSGGGIAGSAAAAGLSQLGYRIAIVEPGIDASRRLAGELVHHTGAAALAELGLLPALSAAEQAEVSGFSVRFGSGDAQPVHLRYSELRPLQPAFAMEHALIRDRMLNAAAALPGVTLMEGSRISEVAVNCDLRRHKRATVRITSTAGCVVLRPRLVVGADGASSPVSRLTGMTQLRQRVSTLFGFLLNRASLPEPGFGHVFLGGPGPVLAYAVSKSAVRVMLDVPDATLGPHRLESCRESLPALPEPLRSQVAERLEQPGIVGSASYRASVRQVNVGRLVLVGDAAGCCHPLTATGLTVCARDALRLRDALRDTDGDIERALQLYALRRRGPQRTRMMLAQVLYEVFCGDAPESRLVRNGLRKYWDGDRRRCAKSLSLVSTEDGRLSFMLLELARVTLSGFSTCISRPWRQGGLSPVGSGLLLGLYRLLLRHAGETLRIT